MPLSVTTQISGNRTQQYVPTYMLEFFANLPNAEKFVFRVQREVQTGRRIFGQAGPDMELRPFDLLISAVDGNDLIESISVDREEFYKMGEENLTNLGNTTTLIANNFLVKNGSIGYTPEAPIKLYIQNDRKLSKKDLEKFLPRATEDPQFVKKFVDWVNSMRTPFAALFIVGVAGGLLYVGTLLGKKAAKFFEFHNSEIQSHGGMDSWGRTDKEVDAAEAEQKAKEDAEAGIVSTPAPATPKPGFLKQLLSPKDKTSSPDTAPHR